MHRGKSESGVRKEEESDITEEGREGSDITEVWQSWTSEVRGNAVSCRKEGVWYHLASLRKEEIIIEMRESLTSQKKEIV